MCKMHPQNCAKFSQAKKIFNQIPRNIIGPDLLYVTTYRLLYTSDRLATPGVFLVFEKSEEPQGAEENLAK